MAWSCRFHRLNLSEKPLPCSTHASRIADFAASEEQTHKNSAGKKLCREKRSAASGTERAMSAEAAETGTRPRPATTLTTRLHETEASASLRAGERGRMQCPELGRASGPLTKGAARGAGAKGHTLAAGANTTGTETGADTSAEVAGLGGVLATTTGAAGAGGAATAARDTLEQGARIRGGEA